jgi:hypothetical protein
LPIRRQVNGHKPIPDLRRGAACPDASIDSGRAADQARITVTRRHFFRGRPVPGLQGIFVAADSLLNQFCASCRLPGEPCTRLPTQCVHSKRRVRGGSLQSSARGSKSRWHQHHRLHQSFDSYEEAERWLVAKLADLQRRKQFGERPRIRFSEALLKYLAAPEQQAKSTLEDGGIFAPESCALHRQP